MSTKVRKERNGVMRFSIENSKAPKSNHTLREESRHK
jgi:hypothetical protein